MKQTPAVESIEDTALTSVPDDELLRQLTALLRDSRRTEAELVAHIGEVDRRRLYARAACPSMFAYCTEVLHLSEHEAYLRITAARAARQHPQLLAMLADGRLHLSGIAKLAPHLTAENRQTLLQEATHRSKQQIEELLAELFPQPDAPALIRRLPVRNCPGLAEPAGPRITQPAGPGITQPAARESLADLGPDRVAAATSSAIERNTPSSHVSAGPAVRTAVPDFRVSPIAPDRYRVQFTASAQLRDKLARLRDLMRSSVPDGDLATLIEEAVTEKLARLEKRKFASTERARTSLAESETRAASRHIPAAVRRAVRERDGGQCAYVGEQGRRCSSRGRLEFHHRRPYSHGGDHSVGNVALLCHVHNHHLAEVDFGRAARPGPSSIEGSRNGEDMSVQQQREPAAAAANRQRPPLPTRAAAAP